MRHQHVYCQLVKDHIDSKVAGIMRFPQVLHARPQTAVLVVWNPHWQHCHGCIRRGKERVTTPLICWGASLAL